MAVTRVNTQAADGALTLTSGLSGGDGTGPSFANDGKTYVQVGNIGVGAVTVNFKRSGKLEGTAVDTPRVETVAAGLTGIFGPFSQRLYNDADGLIEVFYTVANETDARFAAFT